MTEGHHVKMSYLFIRITHSLIDYLLEAVSALFKSIAFSRWRILLLSIHLPLQKIQLPSTMHCVKSVRIRSFSGPCFPAFGLNTERYSVEILRISPYSVRIRENTGHKNSKYGHFLRCDG